MKKAAFVGIAAVVLGLLIVPTSALADSVDFGFAGGTLTAISGPTPSGSSALAIGYAEPGTLFLFGSGLLGIAGLIRRRLTS